MPRFGVAEIVQEKLGADGFPENWQASDFKVGEVSSTDAVTATAPRASRLQKGWNTDALGVLKPGKGGLAPDLWRQMSRAEAEVALSRSLSRGGASPALKEAWRVVLLTAAAPPIMPERGTTKSWLAVRSEALDKLGLYEAAWAMWREVSLEDLGPDEASQLAWVKLRMLAGDGEAACGFAKAEAVKETMGNRWAPVMAACQLVGQGNNPAAVQLSLQVVEPQLKAENPALLRILEAVKDGRVVSSLPSGNASVDALGGSVLGQYPALMGTAIMPRVPDLALRRVVKSEGLPVNVRGQAAVALAGQSGLLEDGMLAWSLVSGTQLSGDLPDAVIVARGTKVSESEIKDYVESALRLGMVTEAGKAMSAWTAPKGTAAAVEIRRHVQARLAVQLLQGRVADEVWDEWIVAQALENGVGAKHAQRTLLVAEAIGVPVPQRIWSQMRVRAAPVSVVVDPAWQRLLADAVTKRNIPQVMLLISEAWNGQPAIDVAPVVAGASVEALRRVGFEGLGRRVAAEALLGLPRKPLVALLPEGTLSAVAQAAISTTVLPDATTDASRTVVRGLNSVGLTRRVSDTGFVLPPPRVEGPTAPTKPVAPKVSR
ncbi:MAG: hypothetical protein DI628_06455 [Blastochloris viridis]|uniref:Uncharacterized protein n=1 Tax=Blastochloris viridis TaxID=1079 RepID=A0A6N4R9X8_BLAVI|nr:MAG: hypothetical protein DI628_06455 [Blastochloris viridis]